jgi:bifunctional non-homologous end joining protein LigD
VRCPEGAGKQCFYQKHPGNSAPDALRRIDITEGAGTNEYVVVDDAAGLVALVQMGVLEIHPWGSRSGKLGFPDRIIFDFDPDDALPWARLVEAVNLIRTLLQEIGLQGFLKTTGGKGLHVVVPIKPAQPWTLVKGFSKAIADLFALTFPDRFTAKVSKSTRRDRLFIDYLRNDEGSTAIAPYSTRAREHAPVAVPVGWGELSADIRFDYFNIKTVPARLQRLRRDPWEGFFEARQTISAKMMDKVGFEK